MRERDAQVADLCLKSWVSHRAERSGVPLISWGEIPTKHTAHRLAAAGAISVLGLVGATLPAQAEEPVEETTTDCEVMQSEVDAAKAVAWEAKKTFTSYRSTEMKKRMNKLPALEKAEAKQARKDARAAVKEAEAAPEDQELSAEAKAAKKAARAEAKEAKKAAQATRKQAKQMVKENQREYKAEWNEAKAAWQAAKQEYDAQCGEPEEVDGETTVTPEEPVETQP